MIQLKGQIRVNRLSGKINIVPSGSVVPGETVEEYDGTITVV